MIKTVFTKTLYNESCVIESVSEQRHLTQLTKQRVLKTVVVI
jgi:hypothetical protein